MSHSHHQLKHTPLMDIQVFMAQKQIKQLGKFTLGLYVLLALAGFYVLMGGTYFTFIKIVAPFGGMWSLGLLWIFIFQKRLDASPKEHQYSDLQKFKTKYPSVAEYLELIEKSRRITLYDYFLVKNYLARESAGV